MLEEWAHWFLGAHLMMNLILGIISVSICYYWIIRQRVSVTALLGLILGVFFNTLFTLQQAYKY